MHSLFEEEGRESLGTPRHVALATGRMRFPPSKMGAFKGRAQPGDV